MPSKEYKIQKFDEAKRTFETRLLFIESIFANKYTKYDIMASCIEHKLDQSFKAYIKELENSSWVLYGKDPLKVLKAID